MEMYQKNSWTVEFNRRFWCRVVSGKFCLRGVPPSPTPSESLDWRGVCKNALQNLEPQGVRGQNLDNKELAGVSRRDRRTAHALTMICFLLDGRKVRCHSRVVEKVMSGSTPVPPFRKRRERRGHEPVSGCWAAAAFANPGTRGSVSFLQGRVTR